ncbi:uncharacterized protein N7515_001917 [Penicillium bovifimosum]|uniref:Uncharacterized protein n=1 Tax=Penicillium bovifimosum TaxID=126998 RepID=A0A9W9L7K7_9EURO|nr:uncharacterized protein N7515_001917 [Penicillium bovifimosum]KAJ5143130.1 hypothetical protein N7515_001917 [Penicillium bovifimosum]
MNFQKITDFGTKNLRPTPRSMDRIWAPLGLSAGSLPEPQISQYRKEVIQVLLRHVWDPAYSDYLPLPLQRFFRRHGIAQGFEREIMRFQNFLPAPVLAMQGRVDLGERLVDLLRYEIRSNPDFRTVGTAVPVMPWVLPAAWVGNAPDIYPPPAALRGDAAPYIMPSGIPTPPGNPPFIPVIAPLRIVPNLPDMIETARAKMPGAWLGPPRRRPSTALPPYTGDSASGRAEDGA